MAKHKDSYVQVAARFNAAAMESAERHRADLRVMIDSADRAKTDCDKRTKYRRAQVEKNGLRRQFIRRPENSD